MPQRIAIDWNGLDSWVYRFSPDGRYITYSSRKNGNADIYLLPINGGPPARVTDHPARDFEPLWTADGRLLPFLSDRVSGRIDLWGVRMLAGKPAGDPFVVRPDVGELRLSSLSNSGRLLYWREREESWIYVTPIDPVTYQPVGQGVKLGSRSLTGFPQPTWSPDGQRIAYLDTTGNMPALRVMAADGTEDREIAAGPFNIGPFAWCSDDHIYLQGASPATGRAIYVLSVSTKELKVAFLDQEILGHVACAPDGSRTFMIRVPLGLDESVPVPVDNPLTAEKVHLGKQLFFDKRLSRDGTVACASCHVPERGFTNGERVATGIRGREGRRNVPTLFNRAYGVTQFWDGRARSLEEQVLEPIQNPREMGLELAALERRLRGIPEYRQGFAKTFGAEPSPFDVARAIAGFVRTLLAANSPFDRFEHGDDTALSEEGRRGLDLFRGRANCTACHIGPNFTDEQFHNTGVAWQVPSTLRPFDGLRVVPSQVEGRHAQGRPEQGRATTGSGQTGAFADPGRFAVTGRPEDQGAFKTPTLREIARTAPYMHDGSLATLEDVIDFYDRGGHPNPHLDPQLRPLGLSPAEKEALLAFLRSLGGDIREGSDGAHAR